VSAFHRRAAAAYDTIDTVPEFCTVRDAIRTGDWPSAQEALLALPPDEMGYALEMLADVDGVEQLLEAAVEQEPGSACARTALARRYIAIAWQVRSGARAENVSREQFEGFRSWLVPAEQQLVEACAVDGRFAPAWAARVHTARALEVGPAEARRRFDRVRAISPNDYPAQVHMLEYVLPKWAGSDAEARAFAEESASEAPPGSHSGALIAIYHLERWLELDGGDPGAAYMTDAAVVDDLVLAAERSVRHADYAGGPIGIQAHSAFAMAFWLASQPDEAAVHFAALDSRATEFPWQYAFDEPEGVADVRARVQRSAGGRARR
jgi:hypothetical protein